MRDWAVRILEGECSNVLVFGYRTRSSRQNLSILRSHVARQGDAKQKQFTCLSRHGDEGMSALSA